MQKDIGGIHKRFLDMVVVGAWLVCGLSWCLCQPVSAAPPEPRAGVLVIEATAQFRYAEECLATERFEQAAEEFRRFAFFFPADERVIEARYRIAEALFKAGQYKKAVQAATDLLERYSCNETPLVAESYFLLAECHRRLNRPGEALAQLNNLMLVCETADVRDRARLQMGWIHVESGAWPQAADAFDAIQAPNRTRFGIDALTESLATHGDIAYKNPSLAGFLSIVPGAGQLYCRRPKDALIAFGVNTVFILAAIEAFNNELYAMGSLLTIAELGFYTGNIYNAVSSAHKYNRRQTEDFIRNLQERHAPGISLRPVIRTNGVMLSLTIPF